MEEVWKDVVGYEGLYQVSNLGRVRSLDRIVNGNRLKGKILSQVKDTKGYLFLRLSKNGNSKRFLVHRLIAEAFIPRIEGKNYIDHINGIRDDNRIENLRWCTHQENDSFPLSRLHRSQAKMGNQVWLGKHHTEESKKKISEARKGKKNPNYWKNLSDENKRKIQAAAYEKNRVEIEQYTKEGKLVKVWGSIASAARALGLCKSNIHKCCNGKNKSSGGFVWKYRNEQSHKDKQDSLSSLHRCSNFRSDDRICWCELGIGMFKRNEDKSDCTCDKSICMYRHDVKVLKLS